MINRLTDTLNFQAEALVLRSERQRLIASNIANADTPGYAARDLNFKDAMANATGSGSSGGLSLRTGSASGNAQSGTTHAKHIALSGGSLGGASTMAYTVQSQPTVDANSVDLDRERANFVDNSVRYEATLRFINGNVRTMLDAIRGGQ